MSPALKIEKYEFAEYLANNNDKCFPLGNQIYCPISQYLDNKINSLHNNDAYVHAVVKALRCEIIANNRVIHSIELPEWAKDFIGEFDNLLPNMCNAENYTITGEACLDILKGIN